MTSISWYDTLHPLLPSYAAAAAACSGVDNLQSVVLVTPTGQLVKASSRGLHNMTTLPNGDLDFKEGKLITSDNSLFWALRGGGGGTFGVAVHFGMRLVPAPSAAQTVTVTWLLYDSAGEQVPCAMWLAAAVFLNAQALMRPAAVTPCLRACVAVLLGSIIKLSLLVLQQLPSRYVRSRPWLDAPWSMLA
jgi:FAD/FMN-containing dehydrogenase